MRAEAFVVLVPAPDFKSGGGRGDASSAGSIPVRFRHHLRREVHVFIDFVTLFVASADTAPLALVDLVTRDLGEAIGSLEDLSILDGATFSDSLFADVSASSDTWVDASEMLATLTSKYYELPLSSRSRATWIINETAAQTLSTITATDGRPMFQEFGPAPTSLDQVGGLLGRPVLVYPAGSSGVPVNEAVFADLSGYVIFDRESMRAESSVDSDFATDQVALRVSRRVDGIISQASRLLRFPAA